jgi:TonB family protein
MIIAMTLAALSAMALPQASPSSWLSAEDYPGAAAEAGKSETISYTLIIGTDGIPQSCSVRKTSGNAKLDQDTCALLVKRARFTPARDDAGNPIQGKYSGRVTWPLTLDTMTAQGTIAAYAIGPAGKITGCEIRNFGSASKNLIACEDYSEDGLTVFFGEPLAHFTSVEVRYFVQVGQSAESIMPAERFDEQRIFSAISLDVSAEGKILGCRVTKLNPLLDGKVNICETNAKIGQAVFAPDEDDHRDRTINIVIDAVATRARAAP